MDNLRKELVQKRNSISKEQREAEERFLCEHVENAVFHLNPEAVLCFYPLNGEVDLRTIYENFLEREIELYFPVTKKTKLLFYRIRSLSDFEPGGFNVMEPVEIFKDFDSLYKEKIKNHNKSDKKKFAAIVPGLVFDIKGNRMGYGKGYYDRFLGKHEDIVKIGVCFSNQLVEEVPVVKETDVPMDIIITGRSVYNIPQNDEENANLFAFDDRMR